MKKILAFLLSVTMILSVGGVTVFAEVNRADNYQNRMFNGEVVTIDIRVTDEDWQYMVDTTAI